MDASNPQEQVGRTSAIGQQVGYSTQQVRDLERLGVIPPADREPNGYRRYTQAHVVALRAYRALAAAIGPVPARQIMPALIQDPLDVAAEKVDELHATIARARRLVREALLGLDAVLADGTGAFDESDTMTIGELAGALGVRVSALRHWEHEGLVHPSRIDGSRTRRYDARAITEARIVSALRGGGYPLPPIARVLDQLREEGLTAEARRLLNTRLTDLSRRSVALLEASGHLHRLLETKSAGAGARGGT